MRSSRILTLKLHGSKIRFIDSVLFFNMALAKLPKALGLGGEVGCKGDFPYLLPAVEPNYHENKLPDLKYFAPDDRKPADYDRLVKWHREEVKRYEKDPTLIYDIKEQMRAYCSQVLAHLLTCNPCLCSALTAYSLGCDHSAPLLPALQGADEGAFWGSGPFPKHYAPQLL